MRVITMSKPIFYYDCIINNRSVCVRVDRKEYYEKLFGAICFYTGKCDKALVKAILGGEL